MLANMESVSGFLNPCPKCNPVSRLSSSILFLVSSSENSTARSTSFLVVYVGSIFHYLGSIGGLFGDRWGLFVVLASS